VYKIKTKAKNEMKKVFNVAGIPTFGCALLNAEHPCNCISRVDGRNLCTFIIMLTVGVLISIFIFIALVIFKSQILNGEKNKF